MYHNTTKTLHEDWLIQHDADNVGKEQGWANGIKEEGAVQTVVPSFGHQSFPYAYGVFWYQKRFETAFRPTENQVVMLRIGAADFLFEAYLNGVLIGTHRGTENPFEFDVTDHLNYGGENLLVFRISKPNDTEIDGYNFWTIPHRNQRTDVIWPGFCHNEVGISGQVALSLQPKLRITDMYMVGNLKDGCVDVEYTIHSDYDESVVAELTTTVGNKRSGEFVNDAFSILRLGKGDRKVNVSVPIDDIKRWSTDDPFLYYVNASLVSLPGTIEGELKVRVSHTLNRHVGFREFKVGQDGYFYLNGKRIFLRCSHTGNTFLYSMHHIAPNPDQIRADLYKAKASGLNMVRFIAGTCLPEQLDYADEIGLMIYEEPMSSWCLLNGPITREIFSYDMTTMLLRDRSHPCICIWGMLNETHPYPPFSDACRLGKELLPLLRQYDRTRLVLYSSGRWDGDAFQGSVSNPFSDKWECLWNKEDESSNVHVGYDSRNPGGFYENIGDIHVYPRYPFSKYDRNLLRTVGCDVKRPVFLSEAGTGSLYDTVWLCKIFEQDHINPDLPDVRQTRHMNECFLRDLKAFGFEEEYAFPQAIMRESHKLHSRQRAFNFDIVRSNPCMNGYSITGLLDHSICGEGLWTLNREWKAGCVDAMANGLAPLKWCLFFDDMHFYAGKPCRFEAVLANEDILEEKDYEVTFRILGQDGVVWERKTLLHPTKEQLATLSIPVLDEMIALDVPTGSYQMHVDIVGAAATDSQLNFYVTNEEDITTSAKQIVSTYQNERMLALLARAGVEITSLADADPAVPAVILVDWCDEDVRDEVFDKIYTMIENGSRAFIVNRHILNGPSGNTHYLRIENKPVIGGEPDWLYHKEYLAKRAHPYFKGMPKGMMDWEYWIYMISGFDFRTGAIPEDIASISFGTGCINPDGYHGGFNIGTYRIGKGALIVNTYNFVETVGTNPAADRLLLNILSTEAARLCDR